MSINWVILNAILLFYILVIYINDTYIKKYYDDSAKIQYTLQQMDDDHKWFEYQLHPEFEKLNRHV